MATRFMVPTSLAFVALVAFGALMALPAAAVPGGKSTGDINSAEVSQAAEIAVALLNDGDSDKLKGTRVSGPLELKKIKSVTTQVVAGMLYEMTVTVKDASGEEKDLRVKLWSRPWLANRNDVTEKPYQVTEVSEPATMD